MRLLTTIFLSFIISSCLFSREEKYKKYYDSIKWSLKTPVIRDVAGEATLSFEYYLNKNASVEIDGSYIYAGTEIYRDWHNPFSFLPSGSAKGYEFICCYNHCSKPYSKSTMVFMNLGIGYRNSYFNNQRIEADHTEGSGDKNGTLYCNQTETSNTIISKASIGFTFFPKWFPHFFCGFYGSAFPALSFVRSTRDSYYFHSNKDETDTPRNMPIEYFNGTLPNLFLDTGIFIGFAFGGR